MHSDSGVYHSDYRLSNLAFVGTRRRIAFKNVYFTAKREEKFGPLGITNIRTFVDPQNPSRVGILMDVADMDVLMGAMQTKEMADTMHYDGVLPDTLVMLVEAFQPAPGQ